MTVVFAEPTTLDEAQDRRQRLVTEMTSLQALISTRKADRSFTNWLEVSGKRLKAIQSELGLLKGWMQQFRRNHQKAMLAGEDAGTVAARARNSVYQLIELVNGMAREIAELNAENASLRDRLREAMPDAPGENIDEWREP